MPGAEGRGGRGAGAAARALRRPPRSPRGGSVPPRRPRPARAAWPLPGSAALGVRAGECAGVPGSAPGVPQRGWEVPRAAPDSPAPHALARNFLSGSCRLADTGSASATRAAGFPAVPTAPGLPGSLGGCLHVPPSSPDCGTAPPGGCPENLQSNQHAPGVAQIWNFIAAGWVTLLHPWKGSPSQACREVPCWLG